MFCFSKSFPLWNFVQFKQKNPILDEFDSEGAGLTDQIGKSFWCFFSKSQWICIIRVNYTRNFMDYIFLWTQDSKETETLSR